VEELEEGTPEAVMAQTGTGKKKKKDADKKISVKSGCLFYHPHCYHN
jgi:hypothetical protein